MTHILLTGAGFSRNWGCWLADEVFEYLLSDPQLSPSMRTQLWRDKNSDGNYETTIQTLRDRARQYQEERYQNEYRNFIAILGGMFNGMRNTYVQSGFQFERTTDRRYQISQFLYQFDSIFTLNQDTLLEHHYFTEFFPGQSGGRWHGWDIPGIQDLGESLGNNPYYTATTLKSVADSGFSLLPQHQPYFKLHGSHNWTNKSGLLLITGGNKESDINESPLLEWYFSEFRKAILTAKARILIIGYGFGDRHINKLLIEAAAKGAKFFIIDIEGLKVLDKRNSTDIVAQKLWDTLGPNIIGASRRPLGSTFGSDSIEHAKVNGFFTQ